MYNSCNVNANRFIGNKEIENEKENKKDSDLNVCWNLCLWMW